MRAAVLARDRYRCQNNNCFRIAEEVHHKIEINESNINDENITLNPNNLISLCSDCHKQITKIMKRKKGSFLPELSFDEHGQPHVTTAGPPGAATGPPGPPATDRAHLSDRKGLT